MYRFLLALFVIMATYFVLTQASCPANEVWNDCGTACPLTCEDPNPGICTVQCVPGCECIDGYVRNEYQKCVELDDC
ncbi:chymotrypsin inhibitor-like [Bombus fervidus]|uniref:chymotrypsin inhibitor-like n=1 Tax=Bombus fervidus TaxID=203811 RepID=UPI003D18847B